MKINTHEFRVSTGRKVHLDKWPTLTKPVYDSKKDYHALLRKQVKELSGRQRLHRRWEGRRHKVCDIPVVCTVW